MKKYNKILISCLFIFSFLFPIFTVKSLPTVEFVTNGDFEGGNTNGWYPITFSISASTTRAHTGTYSCKCSASVSGYMEQYPFPAVTENTDYWFSAYIWVEDTNVSSVQLYIDYFDSEEASLYDEYFALSSKAAAWQLMNNQITTPANTVAIKYCFIVYASGAYEVWVDDISINTENHISEFTPDIVILTSFSITFLAIFYSLRRRNK